MMSLTASKVSPANSYFATYNKMNTLMTKIHPTVPQHLRMPKPSLKNVPVINQNINVSALRNSQMDSS